MSALDWLTARPIAHRGLHDAAAGVIENTPSAFRAAIAAGYGMELDLQISADGEAFVHHDDALGRLTEGSARLADMSSVEIKAVRFKSTTDRMITLGELCDLVAGRATMTIELKSRFDGDLRLPTRAAQVLKDYAGPVALMSFDPDLIEAVRVNAPQLTRGMIAERHYAEDDWNVLSPAAKRRLEFFLHAPRTRPQFVAYWVKDLPSAPALVARNLFGLPLLTWTVRSDDDRRRAARWADQIIFEGLRP
ncbi:MAG TPA: glycerophosphodiester phosphodiesterase family protein [Pseudolabrys sp.]|jgi:glycerophosphoryl diester phosphodiesterase|nr:glycerophosphodiester phosphodiesterase family protein [Pseudolabrys sp.]